MSLIVEKSFAAFFIVTIVLGGGAAFLAGRSFARAWKPLVKVLMFALLLGAAVRFLHWGLFLDATFPNWRAMQGTLLSLHYYLIDTLILMGTAALGYRLERARQMTSQYSWLYERTGLFTWKER